MVKKIFNSWVKAKDDSPLIEQIRRDQRKHRREKGRDGHRFRVQTLKNMYHVDEMYAVLNHHDDPSWQLWYNDPDLGWWLVAWYITRREALAQAEKPLPSLASIQKRELPETGWFVYAGWVKKQRKIVVPCHSEDTASDLVIVFQNLGLWADKGRISAPLLEPEDGWESLGISVNT